MKIYKSSAEFKAQKSQAYFLTIGTFDGVHKGHRKILSELKNMALEKNAEVILLTFYPHPRKVVSNGSVELLNTMEEKKALLEDLGVDHLVIQDFNSDFAALTAEAFIKEIIMRDLHTSCLFIGYDHRFGANRAGSFEMLSAEAEKGSFELVEIPEQELKNVSISSTEVRNAIKEGNIESASMLLDSYFTLSGRVEEGAKLGRTIGFPTANIKVSDIDKITPKDGVYAVYVEDCAENAEQKWKGMLNIGFRPTVDGSQRKIEVHILDFQGNLYGYDLRLSFVKRIRDEIKFDGVEALKIRLKQDEIAVRELFSTENRF